MWTRFGNAATIAGRRYTRKVVPDALDIVAYRIMGDAKRRAPVLTGALRASGRVYAPDKKTRVVQFGGSGTGVDYALFVEFGTMRSRPKPFLRPAVEKNKVYIRRLLGEKAQVEFDIIARQFK